MLEVFKILLSIVQRKIYGVQREDHPNTYVLFTKVCDPNSLVLNWTLTNKRYGVFVVSLEQHYSMIAYLDLRRINTKYKKAAAIRFLNGLRKEAREKKYISRR
jgi:hypothetical protein